MQNEIRRIIPQSFGARSLPMKLMKCAAPAVLLCWTAPSVAAVTFDVTVALNSSDINSSGNLDIQSPGAAFTLLPGQTVSGMMTFANGESVTIGNNTNNPPLDEEWILALFSTSNGDVNSSSVTMSFLGLTGDYIGPATLTKGTIGGAIGVADLTDLTPTSFSFTGVQYSFTYLSGTATTFNPLALSTGRGLISIGSGLPEPTTWAMMLIGFGAIGVAMRRNRKTSRLPQLA